MKSTGLRSLVHFRRVDLFWKIKTKMKTQERNASIPFPFKSVSGIPEFVIDVTYASSRAVA